MTEIESGNFATFGAPCLRRLREYLDMAGVAYEVSRHAPRYTAQELAQVEHVPGKLIAKAVLVMADQRLVMVVLPGTSRINVPWVRAAAGAKSARLATEAEFLRAFPDCEAGAMPPFGNLYHVPVLVDRGLTRDPVIMFNAGTHDLLITMTYADFERLVQPKIGIFAVQPQAAAS
ncbi:MAG TPA: YbaK/EbsC family protein [bacterium]|nr:YbaK/EbsC family protein [bacterium]